MCDFFAQRAENASLGDVEGREYIDFAAGIAVLNTGHRHPRLVAAMAAQLQQFTHTAYQIVPYESVVSLAERLNALVPISGPVKTAFFTTGAEALENAVKIARAHTGRAGVITFGGGFHGRTLMTLAMTGKVAPYKLGFGPFPADVFHVPFPSALQGVSAADSLAAMAQLFKTDIDPQRVAAIVIEPVQGEGGFNVAPTELMQGLRALCDTHGIVLVADEVQTGFARTGKLFSMQHHGVEPDLITMAKSLAGGMPLSAVSGRAAIMDAPAPGGLGGTYAATRWPWLRPSPCST
jgi:4-aminobutyrate aminotransferase